MNQKALAERKHLMICPNCHANSRDGVTFCTNCGAKLPPAASQTQAMPAQNAPLRQGQAGLSPQGQQVMSKPAINLPIVIACVIAALAIIAAALFAFVFNGHSDNSSTIANANVASSSAQSGTAQSGQATSGSADTTSGTGASVTASDTTQDAKEQARQAAEASGKTVLSGTVRVQTGQEVGSERGMTNVDSALASHTFVVFWLDEPTTLTIHKADPTGTLSHNVIDIDMDDSCSAYSGQQVLIAVAQGTELYMHGDIAASLFDASLGNSTGNDYTYIIWSESGGATSTSSVSSSSSSSDYILSNSSTTIIPTSQLEGMDTYSLYLARNEIYARHGRLFNNSNLQTYFNGKSWYHGSISPDSFSDSLLSETEKTNAKNILAVEKSKNSPYLS